MSKLDISILKEIEIDKNHIDNFKLDTDQGTKKTKAKFYKNAVEQRNNYINKEQILFSKYKVIIENEMAKRIKVLMPKDKSKSYEKEIARIEELLYLVKLNSNISDSFKLELDFIVSAINSETSLEKLNEIIEKFITSFKSFGIELGLDDFKYTMFTEKYMKVFLNDSKYNTMKEIFESIYFSCPDVKLQLKMNLYYIISKYKKELNKYTEELKNKLFEQNGLDSKNVILKYIEYRNLIGQKIAEDEYYNTKLFLDGKRKITDYLVGSATRCKNYNLFAINGDYDSLDKNAKVSFNSAILGLYLTLNELKKYYDYENIIVDLLKRYKEKNNSKSIYETKLKELEKSEKERLVIYKEYLKAMGVGIFSRKDDIKMKNAMLKMNEHIKKIYVLKEEINDLEITYKLNNLNDSSSIYDLFLISLSSFNFLEKMFKSDEKFKDKDLFDNIHQYFKFIFNPNNNILRKINCLVDYNITGIVSEKYRLLNLNISEEMINKENIDNTMESVVFINLIQNIEKSGISLEQIKNIEDINNIVSKDLGNTEII